MTRTRLAVLGSPIAHSKSPLLHTAAYRVLGLDWDYTAVRVTAGSLPEFLASLDGNWRGLSLTMPLKREVLPLLDERDGLVTLTGGANTVRFTDRAESGAVLVGAVPVGAVPVGAVPVGAVPGARLQGFNTDVQGVTSALRSHGVAQASRVRLLGAGATAASVIAAVATLGAREILVSTRSPEKAHPLLELAAELGITATVGALGDDTGDFLPDLLVSCLPNGTDPGIHFAEDLPARAALFDVAYDPWPSTLAARWYAAGGIVVPGIDMLVGQALAQVRVFVTGSPQSPLDEEAAVLAAMRESVGLPSAP